MGIVWEELQKREIAKKNYWSIEKQTSREKLTHSNAVVLARFKMKLLQSDLIEWIKIYYNEMYFSFLFNYTEFE